MKTIQLGDLSKAETQNFLLHSVAPRPICFAATIDKAGNIYVTTDTPRGILVFTSAGKFLRSFGPPKIHGLEIRDENGTEVIYGARPSAHEVIKLKLDGTQEWSIKYPEESGACKDANGFNPCAQAIRIGIGRIEHHFLRSNRQCQTFALRRDLLR